VTRLLHRALYTHYPVDDVSWRLSWQVTPKASGDRVRKFRPCLLVQPRQRHGRSGGRHLSMDAVGAHADDSVRVDLHGHESAAPPGGRTFGLYPRRRFLRLLTPSAIAVTELSTGLRYGLERAEPSRQGIRTIPRIKTITTSACRCPMSPVACVQDRIYTMRASTTHSRTC